MKRQLITELYISEVRLNTTNEVGTLQGVMSRQNYNTFVGTSLIKAYRSDQNQTVNSCHLMLQAVRRRRRKQANPATKSSAPLGSGTAAVVVADIPKLLESSRKSAN